MFEILSWICLHERSVSGLTGVSLQYRKQCRRRLGMKWRCKIPPVLQTKQSGGKTTVTRSNYTFRQPFIDNKLAPDSYLATVIEG